MPGSWGICGISDNLSRQPPNDWSLMQGRTTGQDDFGAYRFQLAYMALRPGACPRPPAAGRAGRLQADL